MATEDKVSLFKGDKQAIINQQELCKVTKAKMKEKGLDGPWMSEPDRIEWKYLGFDCLIARNPYMLNLCGYVAVKADHPYYEKDVDVDVHGGITHAEHCVGHICHTIDDENDKVWWLGFDHGHFNDVVPGLVEYMPKSSPYGQHYFTIDEVKHEVEDLARQLAKIK